MSDGLDKIAAALPDVFGKTLAHAFAARYPNDRYRLFLMFSDVTCYELYGVRYVSRGTWVDRGSVESVRQMLQVGEGERRIIDITPMVT